MSQVFTWRLKKMKAIRVHEFGSPEVLKLEEVLTPKPSAGEVLVRIHAAGINPYETYMRAGTYAMKPPLPYTPGSDGAGAVEAVGEGVKKVKRDDRVYTARTLTGAYAEYALARKASASKPSHDSAAPAHFNDWVGPPTTGGLTTNGDARYDDHRTN
jgi:NADPH:quinone reductase-like Zn-dependent oxidoreductase